jgi:hypothetical protein
MRAVSSADSCYIRRKAAEYGPATILKFLQPVSFKSGRAARVVLPCPRHYTTVHLSGCVARTVGLASRFALEPKFSGGKDDEEAMLWGVSPASTRDSQLLAGAEKRFNMNQCTGESNKTMDSLAVLELVVCRPILAMAGYAV